MKRLVCLICLLVFALTIPAGFADNARVVWYDEEASTAGVTNDSWMSLESDTDIYLYEGREFHLWTQYYGTDAITQEVNSIEVLLNGELYEAYGDFFMDCHIPYETWYPMLQNGQYVEMTLRFDTVYGVSEQSVPLIYSTDVAPLCEAHTWQVNRQQEIFAPCASDPGMHYLREAYYDRVCTVCGLSQRNEHVVYEEADSPVFELHSYGEDGVCTAEGCGAVYDPEAEENQNIEKLPEYQAVKEVVTYRILNQWEAREFLNFLFGKEVCKTWNLFWIIPLWVEPEAQVQDYYDLLTGNTKNWSADEIDRVKREFLICAEFMLSSHMKLDSEGLKQRSARLMELTFGVKDIHELTKDKTVEQAKGYGTDEIDLADLIEGLAESMDVPSLEFNPSGALTLMDAATWDAMLNATYTMVNIVQQDDSSLVYGTWNNLRNKRDGQQDPYASILNWEDQAVVEIGQGNDFNTVNYEAYAQLLFDMEQSLEMNR